MTYNMKESLLLGVKTAFANSCSCKNLLSLTSLVESRLVPSTTNIDKKILDAIERKCRCSGDSLSNWLISPKNFLVTQDFLLLQTLLSFPYKKYGSPSGKSTRKSLVTLSRLVDISKFLQQ